MKAVDPGKLRNKITLQTCTTATDAVGQPVETWTDVAVVWAKVDPLSAREAFWAQQVQSSVTHQITCRYDAKIVPSARFVVDGRVYAIDGVRDIESRHTYMIVSAIEQD